MAPTAAPVATVGTTPTLDSAPAGKTGWIALHWGLLMRLVVGTPALLLLVYLGISAYIADRLSRPARNPPTGTPARYGLSYEDVTFNSAVDNIPLSAWYIHSSGHHAEGPKVARVTKVTKVTKVILMAHGRDFSREANSGLEKAAVLAAHGYDVLMFDFRAHGYSGGKRYAMGAWETRDVAGALDYLKGRGVTKIGVYGISLGAAAQIISATQRPEIEAVVSESAYADLPELIDSSLSQHSGLPAFFNPGLLLMARLMFGMDFSQARPAEVIRDLHDRPVLLIHSEQDEFVPVRNVYQLTQAGAGNPNLTTWVVPTGAHCEAFATHKWEYTKRMLDFYDRYLT